MADRPTLSATALCQPEDVKRWGSFPPEHDDTELDLNIVEAINEASERIEDALRRPVHRQTFTAVPHDGGGSALLRLKASPIISVAAVQFVGDAEPLAATEYIIDESRTALIRVTSFDGCRPIWPRRRENVLVTWDAGYDPIPTSIVRNCARFAVSLVNDKTRDARSRQETGKHYSLDRSAIDPASGLPIDIWEGIKKYKLLLMDAPASRA